MISEAMRQRAADSLAAAEATTTPIPPLSESYPDISVHDAYQIQRIQIAEKLKNGSEIRGHKVGLSSAAMQKMMGVDEPDYGHLLDSMFVFEGDAVEVSSLCAPKVEIEVAFVLDGPLAGPACTVADVLRQTAYVAPSIEVIDSRIRDWKIKLADTIADNASSARVVLGACATPLEAIDLRTLGGVLRKNGQIVETGAAGAVLGNPATAVAWLANKVHNFGVTLEAGHVILPGSCTRAVDVVAGDTIRADFDVLGHVSVRFT